MRIVRAAFATAARVRFLVAEVRGGTHRHRTATGQVILVRHRTRDVDLVTELLGRPRAYEPPDSGLDACGPIRVLDLGGNIGLFGVFALARWSVRQLVSFEPDPANRILLDAAIAANRAQHTWKSQPAAVSNYTGTMRFLAGQFAESRQALEHETCTAVHVVDLFALDTDVDLLKIDIESSEWDILADPRLSALKARYIVMEWHSLRCPGPGPDPANTASCALQAAGFSVLAATVAPARDTGVVWARRSTVPRRRGTPRAARS